MVANGTKRRPSAARAASAVLLLCAGALPAAAQDAKPIIDLPFHMNYSVSSSESEALILEWLAGGGDPNMVIHIANRTTPMHYAATGRPSILDAAIRRGGDCDRKDAHGATPLHFAAAQQEGALTPGPESVRMLLRCGADPNVQDRRGNSPLHALYVSVEHSAGTEPPHLSPAPLPGGQRFDVLTTLLAEGWADPNIRNAGGDTPVMLAIRHPVASSQVPEHVSLFLRHGTDPDARNNDGVTPLFEVLRSISPSRKYYDDAKKVIAVLLNGGADPDLRDRSGDTPLIRAAKHKDDAALDMEALLAGGADPCLRDRQGKVAYEHTVEGSDGRALLTRVGGYVDLETGICVRDLVAAEEREKKLGLDRSVRRQLQSCLKTAGFDPGVPDGLLGPRTRAAVRAWQAAQGREGIEAAGYFAQGETNALLAACRVAAPEPLCRGETGSGCWMETSNEPGCFIWNPNPEPEETVTWAGGCADGKASGKGRTIWRFRRDGRWRTTWTEGEFRDGRLQRDGHRMYGDSDGNVFEGPVVSGKRHGHWVERYASGQVWEGPAVNGRSHGVWVRRDEVSPAQCWQNGERMEALSACGYTTVEERRMEATRRVVVRNGPGDEYSVVGELGPNDGVEASAELQGWLWVSKQDGRGGFVRASALAIAAMNALYDEKEAERRRRACANFSSAGCAGGPGEGGYIPCPMDWPGWSHHGGPCLYDEKEMERRRRACANFSKAGCTGGPGEGGYICPMDWPGWSHNGGPC